MQPDMPFEMRKIKRIGRILIISLSLASIALLTVALSLNPAALSFNQPVPYASTAPNSANCPADYCLDWVYGSCLRPGQRYMEQTCFDYPSTAATASACEQEKIIYFNRGEYADPTCK